VADHSSAAPKPTCPFLGTLDERRNPGPCVEYPSFENRCLATGRHESLMLTDQATFCLSTGHRYCPRFIAARAAQGAKLGHTIPPVQDVSTLDSDFVPEQFDELDHDIQESMATQRTNRRRWAWFGAGLIFVSSLFCGGVFAAYVGWQLVNTTLLTTEPGRVDTIARAATPALQPQVYVIVTATSQPVIATPQPQAQPPQANAPVIGQPAPAEQQFPAAVTPTAIVLNLTQPNSAAQSQTPGAIQSAFTAPTGSTNLGAQPAIDVQLEVPTRRPTPIIDIVAPTPLVEGPTATPTLLPTSTPIQIFGPPMVAFSAKDTALESEDCTIVSWHVENVRAVYYENLGVDGHGEREECIDDDPEEYVLTVILTDGTSRTYTTTVALIEPTATPSPSPTYSEPPIPTPTWTSSVPTDTPTPPVTYGVAVAVEGSSSRTCALGETCQIGLLISNASTAIDNISVRLVEFGPWPVQICRLDGICSGNNLTLASVGPSNTAFIHLKVQIPTDESPQTVYYAVQGVSEGSGGSAVSGVARVEIVVQ
jgi:hypothetical protein